MNLKFHMSFKFFVSFGFPFTFSVAFLFFQDTGLMTQKALSQANSYVKLGIGISLALFSIRVRSVFPATVNNISGTMLVVEFLDLLPNDEAEEEEEKTKKKKKLVGLSKRALAKANEEARQHMIKQKQSYLKEVKVRVQMEWEINDSKVEVFENEFQERKNAFQKSTEKLKEIHDSWRNHKQKQKTNKEWAQYLKCNRLPDSSSISDLNSYIFVWKELDTSILMDQCIRKTETMMQLLRDIEEVMSDTGLDRPPNFLKDLKEMRNELRNLLQKDIDKATFYLFSKIESDMVSINVTTSKYFAKCPYFLMNLWAELMTPVPSSHGKEIRRPRKVTFEEAEVTIVIPPNLLDIFMVIRVMWLNYDHWSDNCQTFESPPPPDYFSLSLYDLFLSEYETKKEILNYRENLERVMKKNIESIPAEPTLSQELMVWDSEPQRVLSEEIIFREYEEEDELGRRVKQNLCTFEVNLRERTFLGRFLLLEILHQPPQAKCFRFKHNVTLRQEPPELKPVDFYIKYPLPEEEEAVNAEEQPEVKPLHFHDNHPNEEINKLISVEIKPCESVIWFQQPQLALWNPVGKYWSTEDIHDADFIEEEEKIEFKLGRLGLIGLHVSRYCHLPYEDWLFEPDEKTGINFYLKTSLIEMNFNILPGKVCVEMIKNVPNKVMNWILGIYYTPAELLNQLKKGGIDVFPAFDASIYIDDIESKHVVIERNIYQIWGLFSNSFRFKRSKFNQEAGRKNIVFQAQEIYKNYQVDFCLIQTTMCSSYVLNINEKSENYSSEKAPNMETCVDLFSLLYKHSTRNARRQIDSTCHLLVHTVKEFLEYVRPISFS